MSQLKNFLLVHTFKSDPKNGRLGSIDLNIWLAQMTGIPLMGLKEQNRYVKIFLIVYGMIAIIFITLLYTIFEIYDLFLSRNNLDDLTQNFCLSLTHIAGVLKILNTIYRLDDIKNVMERLILITKKYVISEKQYDAFFRGELENKMFFTIYALLVGSTGVLAMLVLFFNGKDLGGHVFPYHVKLPQWLPHRIQIPYIGFSVLILALQVVSMDYMNITMMNQIRLQLNILNLTFEELSGAVQPYCVMKSIVQHHCILLELRYEVESIYRFPVLLQFFTSVIIFALTGFQATVREVNSNMDMIIYLYCGCIFCQLILYCWFGNDVSEQSKTLSNNGYGSSWYHLDQSVKKSIIIFLINAQRPLEFTAGGFINLSLPSFTGILSRAFSFITILRQVYN